MKQFGLLPLPEDKNDFSLGKIVSYPSLAELPDNFEFQPFKIKDQKQSDFCTGFSTSSVSELQEGVELSPEFAFAMGQKLAKSDWGQNLRTAMQAHTKIGCIKQKDAPFSLENKDDKFLRNPDNWPEDLQPKALIHAKSSYVDCKGIYDAFDNLRAAIWFFREEKRGVVLGVMWESWDMNNPILENGSAGQCGHALMCSGFKIINGKQYLVIINSYGDKVGDNGKFYMTREIVNKYVSDYGAFMFIDMTPEEYLQRLKDFSQNFILRALRKILEILGILVKQKYLPPQPVPEPEIKPEPIEPIIEPPKYLWDTLQNARHSSRVIMDEYNLSWKEKDLLCAVIKTESDFNPKAIGKINKNLTQDFGLCQFNNGKNKQGIPYWIGNGADFESTEEVLNNPEKNVRILVREYKKGNLKLWTSYSSGTYLKYLS